MPHSKVYLVGTDAAFVPGEQKVIRLLGRMFDSPLIKKLFNFRMERYEAISMGLTERDAEPVAVANLDNAIGSEIQEFALPQPVSMSVTPQTLANKSVWFQAAPKAANPGQTSVACPGLLAIAIR